MGIPQTLDGGPAGHGLWPRYIVDGAINHAAWLRAIAERAPVGNCRTCGGLLYPNRPEQHSARTDYTARCVNDSCRYELLAPGGRVMRGTTRRSDQPKYPGAA